MKSLLAIIFGVLGGWLFWFVNHYNQLLAYNRGEAGLLLTIELGRSVDLYMIGGGIAGLLVALIKQLNHAQKTINHKDMV